MTDVKATLKEVIAKASSDEMDLANKLAHAVLEREHGCGAFEARNRDRVAEGVVDPADGTGRRLDDQRRINQTQIVTIARTRHEPAAAPCSYR